MNTIVKYDGKRKKVNPYTFARKALNVAPWVALVGGFALCVVYTFMADILLIEDPTFIQMTVGVVVIVGGIMLACAAAFFTLSYIIDGYNRLQMVLRERERDWKDVSD